MLRELITWVLNTYLGKYLENLNSVQLSVALLSGEVELENIPIRKDALRALNLPVEVAGGSIRKIKLQVPVRQFRTSPWCISVEGLFCIICPKNLESWDYAKEKLQDLQYKLAVLDNAEAGWRSEKGMQMESYYFSSYNNWLKYGTNMATNIIDNIELKIFDVHFRYEDSVDVGKTKIATGIKIASLTAQTCDSNWTSGSFKAANNEMNYKLVELKELSVYWDILHEDIRCQSFTNQDVLSKLHSTCKLRPHNFIIKPICATARWKREKCLQVIRTKDKPRVSCEIIVPEVIIDISKDQRLQMLDKLAGIRKIKEIRQYRLKRPSCSVADDSKLWWKYALVCHGFVFKKREENFAIMRENLRYIRLHELIIVNPNEILSDADKEFKTYIETDRNVSDLSVLRRICFDKVFSKGLSFKSHNVKGKNMLFLWFPNWMGWYSNSTSTANNEQDETIKHLEDDILVALEDSLQSSSDLKCDAVLGHFEIKLLKGLLIIQSDETNVKSRKSMEMQFNNFSAFLQLSPLLTSYTVGVSLEEVYLLDKTNSNTKHKFLIKPQTENPPTLNNTLEKDVLFQLRYENANQLRFQLYIKSKGLDLTYNKDAIHWILDFITDSNKENASTIVTNRFGKRRKNFLKNWNQLFIGNEVNRKTWMFEIEIFAPRIIFLENYKVGNSLMVLLDFGKFEMRKNEAKKFLPLTATDDPSADNHPQIDANAHVNANANANANADANAITTADDDDEEDETYMTPCSTPPASQKSGSESPTILENAQHLLNKKIELEYVLHNKIYDKYSINFSNLQVLVCKYEERWQACLKTSSNFHLIDKFDITLSLEQRNIFTVDPDYPSFTLFGTCPTILIHGNEVLINNFFSIMNPTIDTLKDVRKVYKGRNQTHASEQRVNDIARSEDNSRVIVEFAIGQLAIEMQAKEKSIAELQIIGARAGIIKESNETNITMSVHGLLLVDAIQSFGPDFELLVASHRHVGMDSFSGSLKHSPIASPITPASPLPFTFTDYRGAPMTENAVYNIQKNPIAAFCEDAESALISVKVKIVAPTASNSTHLHSTDIKFNNLDIIANQDTILEILNFANRTILCQGTSTLQNESCGIKEEASEEPSDLDDPDDASQQNHNEIFFDFFRLNILLLYKINHEGRKVGTLTLTEAKINASFQSELSVFGSLGGIQIIDITPESFFLPRILSVGRDQILRTSDMNRQTVLNRLSHEIYSKNLDLHECDADSKCDEIDAFSFKSHWSDKTTCSVQMRMASVSYTHCPRFLQDVNACVTYFKRSLREFFTSIGNKATDMAMEFVQQIRATDVNDQTRPVNPQKNRHDNRLDIIINSPIILLPISSTSTHVLIANLGKMTCSNMIVNDSNEFDESYTIAIKNIYVYSMTIDERENCFNVHPSKNKDAIPILHDTAITLQLSVGYSEGNGNGEERKLDTVSIEGSMVETLKVSLNRKRYELLNESIQYATNFSNGKAIESAHPDPSGVSIPDSDITDEHTICTIIQFSVPVFQINLQNQHHDDLINITFKDFNVKHRVKGYDKDIEIILKSVLMEDLKSDNTSPFRNMVTSINLEKGQKKNASTSSSCPDLPTHCNYRKYRSTSEPSCFQENNPFQNFDGAKKSEFSKKNDKGSKRGGQTLVTYNSHRGRPSKGTSEMDQFSSIQFNCLNLAICVERWYTIFDFFGLIAAENDNQKVTQEKKLVKKDTNDFFSTLKVSIRSFNFTLIRNDSLLSRVNVSNALFKIIHDQFGKSIEGHLGSLSVFDLTQYGNIYKQKFVTSGTEALNFFYRKKPCDVEVLKTLGVDSTLKIGMSAVHYIHTKRFATELHLFVKDLLQLQTPVIRKLKKHNVENDQSLRPTKMKLFIQADSPVIVLPASYSNKQVIIANLGQLTLTNSFHLASEACIISKKLNSAKTNELLDVIRIDLVNINMFSGERSSVKPKGARDRDRIIIANMKFVRLGEEFFKESCYLNLQLERNLSTERIRVCPDISTKGTFSKVNGMINIEQYKLIRSFLNNNIGEQIDDVYTKYTNNVSSSIEMLSSISLVSKSEVSQTILNLISIQILLEDVSILLTLNTTQNTPIEPLACIHFIKSTLEIDLFSDGSQDIDLISTNILIVDERNGSGVGNDNVFRNILQPSKKDTTCTTPRNAVQVEIHCRKNASLSKYTIMLNNMRVFALLDILEQLKAYLMEDSPTSSSSDTSLAYQIVQKPLPQPISVTEFIVNITDSEIIFTEDCSRLDSEAIILKSTTVISYKPSSFSVPISLNINHLEIFSCTLDAEDDSALSIIDPFTLNIELRSNCLSILVQKPLNIRLSYVDVKLFSRMARLLPTQTSRVQKVVSSDECDLERVAPLVAMGFAINDCLYAMQINNWKINDAALWLSQQKQNTNRNPALELKELMVDANVISVFIIDDCMDADVPLLEVSLSKVLFNLNLKAKEHESKIQHYILANVETEVALNYYNRRLSGWEPVAETWECNAKVKFTKGQVENKKRLEIGIFSKQLLKLNITSTFIELFNMVLKNWTNDFNDNGAKNFRQRSPFIPFALQNLTGTPLLFKPIYAPLGDMSCSDVHQLEIIKNWHSVPPNETKTFDFIQKSKLRHIHSHQLNLHQIFVQIHGWRLIGPLSVDKVGVFFRTTNFDSLDLATKCRIIFDISLIGSAQKLIKVKSSLWLSNKLDRSVFLKTTLRSDFGDGLSAISIIKPNDELSLPLKFIDASIYIAHCSSENEELSGNYTDDIGFSNKEIIWKICGTDSIQELLVCYDKNRSLLYTLLCINREIFHCKEPGLPGHRISLLPPLKINNMLCCDLMFKIHDSATGRISASESMYIYNVNIYEPFNLSITLDNFQLSGHVKVPGRHVGIVEPKLKLIDIKKRELHLRISIQCFQGKGMEVYISAPVWIINKTGLPLIYRQDGSNSTAAGQFDEHETARQVAPLMFSFSDQEASPALEVRLGGAFGTSNLWCKSFSMHKDLSHRELRAENTKGSYAIGISVRRGRGLYACTTFLTLSPRFHLHNRSGYILEFIQRCDIDQPSSSNIISAPIDCNFAFHWPNWDQEQYICVRIPDVECCCWSKGIPINEVQSLYINVRNEWSEMFFLRLEVISKDATYILLFTDARTLPPPIRIDNCSEVPINFSQTGTRPSWITPVRAQSSLAYVMDDPSGTQTLLLEAPGGNMVEFPINKTNIKRSLTYSNFIYIAFHDTFDQLSNQERKPDQNYQQLVLGVRGKKVIIMEKNSGDRSQLWLMNSNGQLEHEGSTPPIQSNEAHAVRLVLDLDRAPNPTEFTTLVVRTPNKQRITTQTWRFESGRLMCHANMCVQSRWSANGLQPNSEAVLGRIENTSGKGNNGSIPMSQHIVAQKLRPGSGQLELSMKMDGPICTIEICDIKTKQNTVYLAPDLIWMHASLNNRQMANEGKESPLHEYLINVELLKGIGISIISRKPCEELMFISLELIHCDLEQSVFENSLDLTISSIQIDNQLLDAATPVALHTNCSTEQDEQNNAVVLKLKMLPCPNKNAIIFKYLTLDLKSSIAANLEEKLILKVASFLGYGKSNRQSLSVAYDFENFEEKLILKNMKRYYFENLNIGSTQVRLSASTSSKLPIELSETKKVLGLTLIKFEDAQIELDSYSDKFHFETLNVYLKGMKRHYINQVKWHAASILGSVDFLGNPLGFANDLSEGVSGLIFEGSVTSLVKNVAHGLSNSTAKLTETLSDSLGKVVLDEHDNETRLRILEPQTNTSGGHLAAGLKGFGFGLLGGVTSIVRHTYDGAQSDGVPGFLSGLGKGLVGTVTKPIIGVLDLASETASAVRETSRGTARISPDRKRLPRCVTGATGGLLPLYSNRQSKGQQLLYLINRRNFDEKIIAYDPNLWSDKEARLRLLVSTEFVRIFSFTDGHPTIMLQSHLSEILSCHPLTTNIGTSPSTSRQSSSHYIEISTNLPKITRPRIRCRSEECAEAASRCINYAKSVFHEHEHAVL
ncbi:vacuolar protein sorting-associated protein 13D [Drosophila pseudoobscura]|uniref:Vacuolar protein sorting-associated protein 13D n=9 Tax=Drosophila pseudoobscura TaxID=7237 RepID=A0A6I8W4G3_DROPS|nr:vacuolar protein sorting-associated protein 13D [Drosophila pseudoobscura]